MKLATLSCLALAALAALAPNLGHAEESNADLKAALDECSASVSTDDNDRPDRNAMDTCMTGKGFTKPIGKRGGGRGGFGGPRGGGENNGANEYVDKAQLEAALTECRTMVSTDDNGQPKATEVDTCMEVKGFKKPEKEARRPRHDRGNSANTATATSTNTNTSATTSGSSRNSVRRAN